MGGSWNDTSSSRDSSMSPPPKKKISKSEGGKGGDKVNKLKVLVESGSEDEEGGKNDSKNSSGNSSKLLGSSEGSGSSEVSGSEDESESGSEEHMSDDIGVDEGKEGSGGPEVEDDDDGERSRHSSEEDDDIIDEDEDERKSLRSSRSRSRSNSEGSAGSGRSGSGGSRSGSLSSRSGSDSGSDNKGHRHHGSKKSKIWDKDPEMYGIRRSGRKRHSTDESKPPKLVPQVSKSSKNKSPSKSNKSSPSVSSRKRKISSDDDDESSSDEEVTRTVRKRTNAVSYKEQESEDENDRVTEDENDDETSKDIPPEEEEELDNIEKVIESRDGKKGATGPKTTSFTITETGDDPNKTLPEDTEIERQFLIKWAGLSHLHNTWESFETLSERRVKGLKKLDNFCKKEDDLRRWKDMANIEDVEYMECQMELQQELYKAYHRVERIIAERKNDDGDSEYYIKWECLPYADATWESGKLIQSRDPEVIKKYKIREASHKSPSSATKSLRHRPKFIQIKYQPEYMMGESKKLELRDYQLDGLNWLVHSWCKENSVILADEMGLGKTIQTICFLNYLFDTYQLYGPFLVVVPLSTMAAWQKEFSQWAPQINVVTYVGDVGSRDIIREYEWCFKDSRKMKFNAILTTYEIVLKDKAYLAQIPWAALMVDEAHRLKNGESLLYRTLCEFNTNHRLLITGTPLQNSLKELWSLLHFIMPYKFGDWESFEAEHEHAANKGYSKLHKQLEPYIIRRVKKDVEKSLPAKVEQILRVEMTTIQKQYYKWILTKNYTALRKGVKGSVTSFVNVVMELKKCCNHASLVKPMDQGQDTLTALIKGSGKLMLLDKLLVRLKETGHRVLIFSQMVMMLDIIAEYLQHRRFSFQRLDGSIKGDMRKQALDHFNAEGSQDFCFLLSTRAGGLGINLATADTVIIFDSDWNPMNDLQAQARAHRIGQKNQVNIYRLVTKSSVEEDIVERAKQKLVLDHLVIQRMDTTGRTVFDNKSSKSANPFSKDELNAILKFGAEQLFQDEGENEGDDQCDIDEILRRAETHEEAARPGDELLSAFKVASFTMNEDEPDIADTQDAKLEAAKDWDDIIPKDLRLKVEQEEKEKEMADLYLPPRSSRSQNAAAATGERQPLGNEALNKMARGKKRKLKNDSDDSDYEDDDRASKKRGRPKGHGKDGLKGFTDAQVRKFLKSVKKFPCPLMRIELIAQDCGLIEKNLGDLKKLGELLINGCKSAIAEQKANPQLLTPVKDDPSANSIDNGVGADDDDGKKKPQKAREKGPIYMVCGVKVNARTMSIALEELEPLADLIPFDEGQRKQWKFNLKVKATQYDIEWGIEEDTKLLLGIWEFGMGCFDKIREADPALKEKIFVEGDKKPTLKHVSQRADYLLRVIKKHQQIMKMKAPKPVKEGKKKRETKKAKDENAENTNPNAGAAAGGAIKGSGDDSNVVAPDSTGTVKEKKKRAPRKKKDTGPMHFAAKAEPTPVNVLGDLDPIVFSECKEKMRPVKKALKSLDTPDPSLDDREQIQHTKRCLIQVGDRIQVCLEAFTDKEKIKEWKSNLWYFVSKFTEYDAPKLYRVYKKAVQIRDGKKGQTDGKVAPADTTVDNKVSKDKDKKHKHKHKKDKGKRGGDKNDVSSSSVKNMNENSNSSLGAADSSNKGNTSHSKPNYNRGDRGNHHSSGNSGVPPNKQLYNAMSSEYDRNSNDGFPTTYGQYNRAKQHQYSHPPVSNGPSHYNSPHDSGSSHGYRGGHERSRGGERAPGDPRAERNSGGHYNSSKNYHHYNDSSDRQVGGRGGRGGGSGWNSNRWETSSQYGGSRREDGYYPSVSRGSSSSSTIGAPPPPTIGGLSPYGGGGSSSSSSVGGRIAPPHDWRASSSSSKRQWNVPPSSESNVGGGSRKNSVSRRPEYDNNKY